MRVLLFAIPRYDSYAGQDSLGVSLPLQKEAHVTMSQKVILIAHGNMYIYIYMYLCMCTYIYICVCVFQTWTLQLAGLHFCPYKITQGTQQTSKRESPDDHPRFVSLSAPSALPFPAWAASPTGHKNTEPGRPSLNEAFETCQVSGWELRETKLGELRAGSQPISH